MISSKAQNYRLWRAGAFGNKLHAWRTIEAWECSSFGGRVVLRYLGKTGDGLCAYNLQPEEVEITAHAWVQFKGADRDRIMVNEAAPDHNVVIQGYLWCGGEAHNQFYYSRARLQMRDALRHAPEYSYGLKTDLLLKGAMTPSSWSDFEALREQYHDHVIELSVYSCNLGDTPGRNTLIWEVRQY